MQLIPPKPRRNPSEVSTSLSPPNQAPQFVSSDEDEPYFSDPAAAWPDKPQDKGTYEAPDPNQVVLAMYLMKRSRKTTREVWRKRWFYLTAAGITYTKSHMVGLMATVLTSGRATVDLYPDWDDSGRLLRRPR